MVSALTAAYQGELSRTRDAVAARVAANWSALPDYRDAQIPGFLDASLPIIQAGQERAAALTSAYLSRTLQVAAVGLDVAALLDVRNGVDPAEVYRRPFVTTWAAIDSLGLDAAIAKGLSRLTSTVEMDVAMTARNSLLAFGNATADTESRIVGWTRVADPGCCDFCQMINGAHTGPTEPQPLHNRCGCTAEPITRATAHRGGRSIADVLKAGAVIGHGDAATAIREHGELGPVITAANDSFAGPNDLDDPSYIES